MLIAAIIKNTIGEKNVPSLSATAGDLETCEAFGAEILKLCVEVGGCLTGEHGVGIEKRDLMNVQFNANDLEAQMRIKDVFDPKWLLNPAKVFPLADTKSRRENGLQTAAYVAE